MLSSGRNRHSVSRALSAVIAASVRVRTPSLLRILLTWNLTVERKITEDTEAAGRTVRASADQPQYEVTSEKSGGTAVHKPSALEKD